MAKDSDVPTIFKSRRVRAPSVIVTSEEAGDVERGAGDGDQDCLNGLSSPLSARAPLTPQSSISSAPPFSTQPSLQQAYSESAASSQDEDRQLNDKHCPNSCCSRTAIKYYYGLFITFILTISFVTATHCIKYMYVRVYVADNEAAFAYTNTTSRMHTYYNAPFFTTWFCTNWLMFFYPIYIIFMFVWNKCKSSSDVMSDAFKGFRDKGFTFARFTSRCSLFCLLWVCTMYMYTYSLKILLSTDVVSLFATNVSCIYLLSWVILHEQFVGVRIVAMILCDTGIALLAYMDGIMGNSTLSGVVLAAFAAAGFGIFRVLSRKVMGDLQTSQRALFFTIIGVVNAAFLWPISLTLYLSGSEVIPAHDMPWIPLMVASICMLVFNMFYQFGNLITYNIFVSMSLVTAIPVSSALDAVIYDIQFEGMKLAGIILIVVGFLLVMFPDDWPNYIMKLLKWSRSRQRSGVGSNRSREPMDYRTGHIRSNLRSPSGRVR